jgi:hypothetical protein
MPPDELSPDALDALASQTEELDPAQLDAMEAQVPAPNPVDFQPEPMSRGGAEGTRPRADAPARAEHEQ